MNYQDLIMKQVAQLENTLGDLLLDIEVQHDEGSTIDVATNKKVATTSTKNFKAVIDKFSSDELGSWVVQVNDVKIVVIANNDVIDTKDKVVMNGLTWEIVKSFPQYIGNQIALYTLQIRK